MIETTETATTETTETDPLSLSHWENVVVLVQIAFQ